MKIVKRYFYFRRNLYCYCQKVSDALSQVLDNHFCLKNVASPIGINWAPLVAHLFLFYYERDFIRSFFKRGQLMVLKLSIQLLGTEMICLILIISILKEWFTRFIPLNFSSIFF